MSSPPPQRRTAVFQIGRLRLEGPAAQVVSLFLLAGVLTLVVLSRPSVRMLLSAALWIAFQVYWNVAARGAAPAKSSESRGSRMLHQDLMIAAFVLLFAPIPGLRARFLPLSLPIVAGGLALQAAFFRLAIWARRHLGRNWSGKVAIKVDHELVRSGPYRVLRHPIYTAMLGMFSGTALVSGEVHALVAVALIGAAYWRKILLEERNLRAAFGAAYDEYRRRSWAIIPWLV